MNKRKTILIIGLIAVILILTGLAIWKSKHPSEKPLLQKEPGLPEAESGYKVVANKFDGYEITVPSNWQTTETASASGGFKAYYNTLGDVSSAELTEGVMLAVITFDDIEKVKSLFPASARFADVETSSGRAYKTSYKAFEDRVIKGEPTEIPIENSLVIKYIFPSDKKVYLVSCLALGDNFNELASLCEKQILTFRILR